MDIASTAAPGDLSDIGDRDETRPLWAGVTSLSLGVFGLVTAEFLPASLLTPIAADLGVTDGAAGQTVTATAIIGAVAGLFAPVVTGKLDRRVVMWALTVLLIVSSALAAIAPNLPTLLAARLLLGVGIGGFWSMAAAMAMRMAPARLGPGAISLIFTGVSIATVSAAPIGAYLGGLYGWRVVFWLAGAIGVVTLIAQLLTIPRMPPQSPPSVKTIIDLLRRPSMRLVLITILLAISGHFAGFTYVRPFLEQTPKLSIELISLALLGFGVGGFFGNFAGAAIVERSAGLSVITGALMIAAMALALTLFGASLWASAAAVTIWGFAFGFLPVGFQTWTVRAAPDQTESASGLVVAAFQVAIASGAIFGGLFVDHIGALGAIGYAGVAALLGALLVMSTGGARNGAAA